MRWVFGGTPDRVVDLAMDEGVPVIVYASGTGARGRVEDLLFPIYRYAAKVRPSGLPARDAEPAS